MRKTLPLLKMAPLLCPIAYLQVQRNGSRSVPTLTSAVHNSPAEIRGACDKKSIFWPFLRDCRNINLPPAAENEEGEAGSESLGEECGENGENGENVGTWKFEERLFDATAADRTRGPGAVADIDWLRLTDRELQMHCRVETLRSSGPGGQHRNTTESAVRLLHLPTGLVSFAAEDRSQHKNRAKAFKRLREVIALSVRRPVDLKEYKAPPELMRILPSSPQTRSRRGGSQQIGPNHVDFVLGVQPLLDLLEATKGSISECAATLGLSTGSLSRLIVSNKLLWKGVNNLRAAHSLKPLRGD